MTTPRTRLYVNPALAANTAVGLTEPQVHYLRNVLRFGTGVEVGLFNGKDGEWLGRITTLGKDSGTITPEKQLRAQETEPDLWLLFAPIKRAAIDLVAEKASELGASAIIPVLTKHTDVARVNTERLLANAVEAAEQCGRLSVPAVYSPVDLPDILANWSHTRPLYVAAESGPSQPMAKALAGRSTDPAAILIGPEGGFARSELELLASLPYVVPVRLGPRILRAETAALAALSIYQAVAGDWTQPPEQTT